MEAPAEGLEGRPHHAEVLATFATVPRGLTARTPNVSRRIAGENRFRDRYRFLNATEFARTNFAELFL
jgi:hypothetical protein